jgi:ribose-phosphate pyrophosphokinase
VRRLCLALPGNDALGRRLAERTDADFGRLVIRHFPDGESYVRIDTEVTGRDVVLACTLDRPDPKILPLLLVAATARDLGARRVGLVAPYLAYLRQDGRFAPGEGVTSRYFARLLSSSVDWLVTVDPHLHRYTSLAEIYPIPTTSVSAAPLVADWIRTHVSDPLLVGPDAESARWVAAVAGESGAPFVVLEKRRRGDREVEVSLTGIDRWRERTAVLIDDIISTGRTIIATIRELGRRGMPVPVVIGVHAVFAERAYEEVLAATPARVFTTNTISHTSNEIDVIDLLASGIRAHP